MMKNGIVFQINASKGGVPKWPMRHGFVTESGLEEDVQRNKKHHGGPNRALCLYSLEKIQQLQLEGHPIYPGSIGENLTLSGFDWSLLTPGVQLKCGSDLLIEITSFTVPCKNIRESFVQNKFSRISQKINPGWARVYAKVLQPGRIQIGDVVTFG